MAHLSDIGSEIARKRRALNLSQTELARKTKISRATLDALENQRAGEIGYSRLARILAALGLELKLQTAGLQRPTLEDLREEDRDDQSLDRRR